MVTRFIGFLYQEVRGLHEAAYLLGFFALLSQLLGLIRDRLLAGAFGAGVDLDIYYASFRIPDIIFVVFASMVSTYVLIPILSDRIAKSRETANQFLNNVYTGFSCTILVASVISWALTPSLLSYLYPSIMLEHHETMITLTRLLLLQPILLGVSNIWASVSQMRHKFVLYVASPILYNVGIISGVLVFREHFGILGVGIGVVIGAMLHALIQAPILIEEKLFPRLTLQINWQELLQVVSASLPRTLGLSLSAVLSLMLIVFASKEGEGSVAVFSLATNLQAVPLTVIGISYSVAAFPTLSRLFAEGERELFLSEVMGAARHILFWSIPAVTLFIVLRAQIVRVILGTGQFDWTDTRLTAAVLALFMISVPLHALIFLFARGYYASGNTSRPPFAAAVGAIVAISVAFLLRDIFVSNPDFAITLERILRIQDLPGTGVVVYSLAYSIGIIVQAIVLLGAFRFDFGNISVMLSDALWKSSLASMVIGMVSYVALQRLDDVLDINTFTGILIQGVVAGLLGIGAGIIALRLLGSEELREAWKTLHARLWKVRTGIPGTEEG